MLKQKPIKNRLGSPDFTHCRRSLNPHTTGQRGGEERRFGFHSSHSALFSVQNGPLLISLVSLRAWWAGAVRTTATSPTIQEKFPSQGGGTEALLHCLICFFVAVVIPYEKERTHRKHMRFDTNNRPLREQWQQRLT